MTITKEELRELYNNNTVAEVARRLGVSRETVYKRLRAHGIPLKEPKGSLEIVG